MTVPFIHITVDQQSLDLDYTIQAHREMAEHYCTILAEVLNNEYPDADITVELETGTVNGGQTLLSEDDEWEGITRRDLVLDIIHHYRGRILSDCDWPDTESTI